MGSIPVGVTKRKRTENSVLFLLPFRRNGRTPGFAHSAVDGKPLANCVCIPLIKGRKPVGVTKQVKGEPVSFRRRIRFYHILQKDLLNEKRRTRVYLTRRFCFVTTAFQIRRFCRLCISDILLFVKRIIH